MNYKPKFFRLKTFKLLLIAFLAVSITSCSSDDDGADTSASILGVWIGQDVDYSGTSTTTIEGLPPVTADFVGETTESDFTLTFTEDPNELVSEGSYTVELTFTIAGETQTQTQTLNFLEDGTWSRSGDTLTVTADGVTQDYQIVELTESTLRLSAATTTTETEPTTGASVEVTINLEAILTR